MDVVRNQLGLSETVVDLHVMPVIGGGSHIHRLKWNDGNTHTLIADTYESFTYNFY